MISIFYEDFVDYLIALDFYDMFRLSSSGVDWIPKVLTPVIHRSILTDAVAKHLEEVNG